MNVTLPETIEDFVRRKVESGDYRSAEEVVSAGLRLLQRHDAKWAASSRAKIEEGMADAEAGRVNSPEEVRKFLDARKAEWWKARKK